MRSISKILCASVVALAPFAATTPANALVTPAMTITITTGSTSHRVCGVGTADATAFVTGQWQLAVSGERSDGSAIRELVGQPGRLFNQCVTVLKSGTAAGNYVATLEYVGVGADVAGTANRTGGWAPVLGDFAV